ncbi:MAG TPA: hypothetical protein VMG60_15490 [Burkholderiaceae bacterium]|nr:hypothetical protein [Burkholderiaceae bacterium]
MANLQSRIEKLEAKRSNVRDPFDPYRWHPGGDFWKYWRWHLEHMVPSEDYMLSKIQALEEGREPPPEFKPSEKDQQEAKRRKPSGWDQYWKAQPRIQLATADELLRIVEEREERAAAANAAWEASQQAKQPEPESETTEGAPARWVPAMPQRTQQRVTLEGGHLVTKPVTTRDPLADYREPNLTEDQLVARLNDTQI